MEKTIYNRTPIGYIEAPSWEVKQRMNLSDEELLQLAIEENKRICISPTTYSMIERRGLDRVLQQLINPNVGANHMTLALLNQPPQDDR